MAGAGEGEAATTASVGVRSEEFRLRIALGALGWRRRGTGHTFIGQTGLSYYASSSVPKAAMLLSLSLSLSFFISLPTN